MLKVLIIMSLAVRSYSNSNDLVNLSKVPKIVISNSSNKFKKWMKLAEERIFSLAAGNRAGYITPSIMKIGLAKILYAADQLGSDIDNSKSYIVFAPDGTITYNPIRIKRGFTYGAIMKLEFDGMVATSNSMPNGCGFSMYEIIDPPDDQKLRSMLTDAQYQLGKDQLSQLGKGNHFAGVYYVKDPITGEDTNRRFVVVHCSGHFEGPKLYNTDWLKNVDGYHSVNTAHGKIDLLESDARKMYFEQYKKTDKVNAMNRDITMEEIFPNQPWKKLEEITHQGLIKKGKVHIIGTQRHQGMVPIAFNPEEGLIAVKSRNNLSRDFINCWSEFERAEKYNLTRSLQKLNITPHGGGYEFRYPLKKLKIILDKEGIHHFELKMDKIKTKLKFNYFREIREYMTYRRRSSVMREVYRANLARVKYELPGFMQIYPIHSVPGGTH